MSSPACAAEIILTKEHRRFAEFCDACRRYRYIGICYGPPGVGQTLSAQHYANWPKVDAYWPFVWTSPAALREIMENTTVFYTPKVVNAPGHIARDIQALRDRLRALNWEAQRYQEEAAPGVRLPPTTAGASLRRSRSSPRRPSCGRRWCRPICRTAWRPQTRPACSSLMRQTA